MKNPLPRLYLATVLLLLLACSPEEEIAEEELPSSSIPNFKNYDDLQEAQVMILGTLHFDETALEASAQAGIDSLLIKLARYAPTKIVLEWEPSRQAETNRQYQAFLRDSFDISQRYNEVYQLGFQLGKRLQHDSLFLFDDQTPFIGSLEDFSFDGFTTYADANDAGFYDKHLDSLIQFFTHNQEILRTKSLHEHICWLNAPEMQHINAQRMHMFEVRAGIQDSWIGPDWLGRWYQRNVRMMSNVLTFSAPGDRILIIVGDNHKWILDTLFGFTPDFEVVSSWEILQ